MVTRLSAVEPAIQGHDSWAGRPVQIRPGSPISADSTIWAVIASLGLGWAFTAAFQPA